MPAGCCIRFRSPVAPPPISIYFPDEVLERICHFIDIDEFPSSFLVSKQWFRVALRQSDIWSRKYVKDFGGASDVHRTKDDWLGEWKVRKGRHAVYETWRGHPCYRWLVVEGNAIGLMWCPTQVFMVDLNNTRRTCRLSIPEHAKSVACNGKEIVVGFGEGVVGVWDFGTGVLVRMLDGHNDRVTCVDCDANYVSTGSRDRVVKVWRLVNGVCIARLHGHTSDVTCVRMWVGRIVSASLDKTLKIWDVGSATCIQSLQEYGVIGCLSVGFNRMVSVVGKNKFKVWNVAPEGCTLAFEAVADDVKDICIDDSKIVTISKSGEIAIWDIKQGARIRAIDVHWHAWMPSFVSASNGRILFGGGGYIKELQFV